MPIILPFQSDMATFRQGTRSHLRPTDMSQSVNVSLNGGKYLMDQSYLLMYGRPVSTLEDCTKRKLTV